MYNWPRVRPQVQVVHQEVLFLDAGISIFRSDLIEGKCGDVSLSCLNSGVIRNIHLVCSFVSPGVQQLQITNLCCNFSLNISV